MKTIEEIYAEMFEEHERIFASNPYGCNQYGHRKGHNGGSSSNKSDSSKKEEAEQKKGSEDTDENKSEPANEKREGDHFDNIEGEMIDAVARAIIHNQNVYSSGFEFGNTKSSSNPNMELFISSEELSHLRKEYKKNKLNPYKMAEIFVRYDGKRAWNNKYSPKYPSNKK
jgi:hypothetical protein